MPNYIDPVIDGEKKTRGLIPRDYNRHPVGYLACAKPFDLPLIDESEWEDRLQLQIKNKAQLSDIRDRGMNGKPIPSRDQNGRGYCWAHSGVSAMLLVRALNNQPYVDLSAYMPACIIKKYRDEGGWGSAGLEWMAEHGCASSQFWPQKSVDKANDNPACRENAKLHRVTEWMDMEPKNKKQFVTCLLLNIPVVTDLNWWGHSICTVNIISFKPFKTLIWNSWSDKWGTNGMGPLEGSKAIPDGMIAPRVLRASTI